MEDSMNFDGDIENVNGEVPIMIDISASGTTAPLTGSGSSEYQRGPEMRFLPPHLDPLIPVRKVTKTIDTSEIRQWENHLNVRFPSGSGVRAWLGDGGDDKVSELDVKVINGYPTLVVDPEDGTGDHITLELTVGPYFAFNNVTACFFSTMGAFVLILLLIVLLIIRGIVRRKRKKAGEEEEGPTEGEGGSKEGSEGSEPDPMDKEETLKW